VLVWRSFSLSLAAAKRRNFRGYVSPLQKKYGFPSIYSVGDFTVVIGSKPFNPRDIDNLYIDFLRTQKSIESWLG
jgi:hypothetical protein